MVLVVLALGYRKLGLIFLESIRLLIQKIDLFWLRENCREGKRAEERGR
jgi:hypothetical protein